LVGWLSTVAPQIMSSNESRPDGLELLTNQMGHLTELITTALTKLERIAERQAETIDRQEQNITRLVGIAERLLDRDPRSP
jgi:hypothetical protein